MMMVRDGIELGGKMTAPAPFVAVAEYLEAGVLVVCVVDPKRQCFVTYYPDRPEETIGMGEVWRAAEILPGFEMPVQRVFGRGR